MPIAFDGASRRIILTATTTLSVRELWSRYVDWLEVGDNSRWPEAMRQVGGDVSQIPIYIFMLNGWRIVPMAANHSLEIFDGVLYVEGGGDPFVDPAGSYSIRIIYQAPGIAIGYETGGSSGPSAGSVADAVWSHGTASNLLNRVFQVWVRLFSN